MNAMTWWDHGTESVWAQPWGAVIRGSRTGQSLTLLPGEIVRWGAWIADHPETLVLVDERGKHFGRQVPNEEFVIGVAIQDAAVGYYFPSAKEQGVVNDDIGGFPVVVLVNQVEGDIDVYLRTAANPKSPGESQSLTFELNADGLVQDVETKSTWDVDRGAAVSGPLRGTVLQQVPYISSFDWAWEDFYPATSFWGEKPIRPLPDFFG